MALLVFAAAAGAWTDDLRAAVEAARTPEATVVFVQAGEVYLDRGTDSGLRPGARLVLERPGGEIRHPETGEVIGAARRRIGRVEVTWADERLARARIVESTDPPAIRDVAAPEGPTRVALLRIAHADGRATRLGAAIDDAAAGALAGLEGVAVEARGPPRPRGPADAADAAAAAREAGAALAVAGRIDGARVDLLLVDARTGRVLRRVEGDVAARLLPLADSPVVADAPAAAASGGAAAVETSAAPAAPAAEPLEIDLPFEPIDVALGDVTGAGRDEVISTDGRFVVVWRVGLGEGGGNLVEVGRYDGGLGATFILIGAADLDGDGRAEVLVTDKPGNTVRSMVLKWDGNRFQRIWRESGMMIRTLRVRGEDRIYAQDLGHHTVFDGPVWRLRWNGRSFDEEASGLPSKVTLLDFAPMEPTGLLVSIDFEEHLRLYDAGGTSLWRSPDEYDGSDVEIQARAPNVVERPRRGIAAHDVDGDGVDEIVVVQHRRRGTSGSIRIGRRWGFESGRLVIFARDRSSLVEKGRTREWNGAIRGLSIGDVRGLGPEAVYASVEGGGPFDFGARPARLRVVPLAATEPPR